MIARTMLLGGTAAFSIIAAQPAFAQTADTPVDDLANAPEAPSTTGLEQIIVTAQRRDQSLLDVPIAISAFTSDELQRRNVNEALDLIQYVPNLAGSNNVGLSSANTYYLRGLGDTESLATKDPSVGTYIDDIYFARQIANNFSFFDVERIEVLRGPQGTLFGRNTTGGAIVTVLARPGDEFGGSAELAYGRFDRVEARATIDAPLSDNIRTKISGFYRDDNGYAQNVTTGETVNDEQGYGGRVAVRALFGPVTWDVSGTYMYNAGTNLANFECNPLDPTDCDGRFVTTGLRRDNTGGTQLPNATISGRKADFDLGNETETYFGASKFAIDFDDHVLEFITGFIRTEQRYNVDFFDGRRAPSFEFVSDPDSGLPTVVDVADNITLSPPVLGLSTGGFDILNDASTDQFSQEIKLNGTLFDGALTYVTGLYYFREESTSDFADVFGVSETFTLVLADRVVANRTDALAGYFQADLQLTDRLSVTAGIRYTDEDKKFNFADNRAQCTGTSLAANCIDSRNFQAVDNDQNPATPPIAIPLQQNEKIFTPRFVINYEPVDGVNLYASATRGFKSGGQSGRSTQVRLLLPFGPETIWSYEGGIKAELFDRKVRVSLNGFYSDVKNLQGGSAFITDNDDGTQSLNFVTRNFADFENKGIELEIQAAPVAGLNLFASLGYQQPEYVLRDGDPDVDTLGILSASAQLAECRAALAGQASPLGNAANANSRAAATCGSGIVTTNGEIASPVRAPDLSLSGGFSYRLPIGNSGFAVIPTVNAVYTSDIEVGSSNTSFFIDDAGVANVNGGGEFVTGSFSEERVIVNAGLAFDFDGRFRASIECSNCFDVVRPTSTLSNYTYLTPPGTWLARIGVDF